MLDALHRQQYPDVRWTRPPQSLRRQKPRIDRALRTARHLFAYTHAHAHTNADPDTLQVLVLVHMQGLRLPADVVQDHHLLHQEDVHHPHTKQVLFHQVHHLRLPANNHSQDQLYSQNELHLKMHHLRLPAHLHNPQNDNHKVHRLLVPPYQSPLRQPILVPVIVMSVQNEPDAGSIPAFAKPLQRQT